DAPASGPASLRPRPCPGPGKRVRASLEKTREALPPRLPSARPAVRRPTMSSRAPITNLSILPLDRVTTTFELPGHRVVRNLGVLRGIVVRSRNIVGTCVAGLQTLFGGNITLWTEMCEQARREAFELMALHARQIGANAVIGARYDATEISAGVTEVLCYGSAVVVEPV